jgi:hypothetical protein
LRLKDTPFLIAASVLHLAVPVGAAIAPSGELAKAVYARATMSVTEIEVDVDLLRESRKFEAVTPPERRIPSEAPRPNEPQRKPTPGRVYQVPTADPHAPPPEDILEASPESPQIDDMPSMPDAPPPANEYDAPPAADMPGVPGIPGLGGQPIYAMPGMMPDSGPRLPAPTQAPRRTLARDQGEKAVRGAIRAKDRRLGLDLPAASAIAAVVVSAVRASDAPHVSRGSFSIVLGGNGRVRSVSLAGFTGGTAATWQAVRAAIQARLASRTYPMRSNYAKGAMISVTANSQVKMPGGGTSRSGLTMSFDVTDAAAKPVRVVSRSVGVRAIE